MTLKKTLPAFGKQANETAIEDCELAKIPVDNLTVILDWYLDVIFSHFLSFSLFLSFFHVMRFPTFLSFSVIVCCFRNVMVINDLSQVWWWSVKVFVSYGEKKTDWQTNIQIVKKVTISLKHGYSRPILSSCCDVISDAIVMKFNFVDYIPLIVRYLMPNYVYIENCEIFKSDENLRSLFRHKCHRQLGMLYR